MAQIIIRSSDNIRALAGMSELDFVNDKIGHYIR